MCKVSPGAAEDRMASKKKVALQERVVRYLRKDLRPGRRQGTKDALPVLPDWFTRPETIFALVLFVVGTTVSLFAGEIRRGFG